MALFKIIIIGGGLAGCLLANGLHQKGVEVVVYERLSKDSKREGYQIRLGAPSLEGFRACLHVDQVAELVQKFGRASGTKSAAPIVYDRHLRPVLDLTVFPNYAKSASINRVVLRDTLATPLVAAGKLFYDKQFDRYEIVDAGASQERVRVWFTDGMSDECSLLIAADGNQSKINRQVGLDNIQTLTTHMSAVSKTELKTTDYLTLSSSLTRYPVLAFDSNKTAYFAAYLPDKLDVDTEIANTQFDDELSSCFFALSIPSELWPPNCENLSASEKWDFISLAIRNWASEYHEIIALLKSADVHIYRPRASVRPPKDWRNKARTSGHVEQGHPRVWLMGDAIHAMLPNRGQGGNQSMRDTATLLPLLVKLACTARCGYTPTTEEIAASAQEYEDEMIPRAFNWVQKSGGTNVVPVDANTLFGRIVFFLLARATVFATLWTKVIGFFRTTKHIDDAPELRS